MFFLSRGLNQMEGMHSRGASCPGLRFDTGRSKGLTGIVPKEAEEEARGIAA